MVSTNAASKRAAADELRLVESKLSEVERQLRALKDERSTLLSRKVVLKETVEAQDVAADVDWSSDSFPWSGEAERIKKEVFGIAAPWRPDQKEIINATLSEMDTFVVMRTGGGKSLCFQLPALLPDKGLSLVISPLISLISDQCYQLESIAPGKGVMLAGAMSQEESNDVLRRMKDPRSPLRLVYVTPEKVLTSKLLMSTLEKLNEAQRLDRFVVDEAHCCSSMGNDFRPEYQKLSILRKLFPHVPILAVTATATPQVLRDVTDILQMSKVEFFKSPFNRPNLFYRVQPKPAGMDEAVAAVWSFLRAQHPRQSGIVYCLSQKECETVAAKLALLGIATGVYHAGLDAELKDRVLRRWTADKLQVVVATIAFGMGINKPDVRFVIHFSIPKSIENYLQESGRAGRDGQISTCLLLYRASDVVRQASLVIHERVGLQKLRTVVEYAQLSGRVCRRIPISRALGEGGLVPQEACQGHCDVCSGEVRKKTANVTRATVGLIKLLRGLAAKEKRCTHRQLADLWLKEARKERRAAVTYKKERKKATGGEEEQDEDEEGGEDEEEDDEKGREMVLQDKETVELLLNQLVVESILGEDYHATAYSINAYVVVGYRAAVVERGEIQVWMEVEISSSSSSSTSSSMASAAGAWKDGRDGGRGGGKRGGGKGGEGREAKKRKTELGAAASTAAVSVAAAAVWANKVEEVVEISSDSEEEKVDRKQEKESREGQEDMEVEDGEEPGRVGVHQDGEEEEGKDVEIFDKGKGKKSRTITEGAEGEVLQNGKEKEMMMKKKKKLWKRLQKKETSKEEEEEEKEESAGEEFDFFS